MDSQSLNTSLADGRIGLMDMNGVISSLLEHRGWGLLAVIVLVVIISIINNPSIISEITKLADRFSKSKEVIEYGNYTLFKLTRTQPRKLILALRLIRLITTAVSVVMLIILGFLGYLILISPPLRQNVGFQLSLLFLFLFPTVFIIDAYAHIRSSVDLELDGDLEILIRFCVKKLFDIGASITRFDVGVGELKIGEMEAILYGNHVTIKIEKLENLHNRLTLNSDSQFISYVLYSAQYRREVNNLIRSLCYPAKIN